MRFDLEPSQTQQESFKNTFHYFDWGVFPNPRNLQVFLRAHPVGTVPKERKEVVTRWVLNTQCLRDFEKTINNLYMGPLRIVVALRCNPH